MGRRTKASSHDRKKSRMTLENCIRNDQTSPARKSEAIITRSTTSVCNQRLLCIGFISHIGRGRHGGLPLLARYSPAAFGTEKGARGHRRAAVGALPGSFFRLAGGGGPLAHLG